MSDFLAAYQGIGVERGWDLVPIKYLIANQVPSDGRPGDLTIEYFGRGWVVRLGWVGLQRLTRSGRWEYEPQPSERDEEFVLRTCWSTAEEALVALRESGWPDVMEGEDV